MTGPCSGTGTATATGRLRYSDPNTITWYLSNTDSATDTPVKVSYGMPGDVPLAGDWTGTGTQTIGVYRPSNATFYLRNSNTSGVADMTIPLGDFGDVPLVGDFDVTGIDKIGVYRPGNATFYETHATGPVTSVPYGNFGDRPLAGTWGCGSTDSNPRWAIMVFRPSEISWHGWYESHGNNCQGVGFTFGDPSDLPLFK